MEQKRRRRRRKRLRQGKKQGVAEVETPDTTMFLTVSTKWWMRSHKQILTFKNTSSVNARCFATKLLRRGALLPSPSGEGFDKDSNDIAYHNAQNLLKYCRDRRPRRSEFNLRQPPNKIPTHKIPLKDCRDRRPRRSEPNLGQPPNLFRESS